MNIQGVKQMNKDALYRYFEQHYIPKRDMLPRIPLGTDPDGLWEDILSRRKARGTQLPILGPRGMPYWYVTTEKMVSASEMIVEELMAYDGTPPQAQQALSPLEEVFYTSYVEGSPMSMQEAMEFLQGDMEPSDVREQMIVNNRSALSFAGSNLYHPVDAEFIGMLAMILTQNMDGGGNEYRTSDWVDIPSMMGEPYALPAAVSLQDRVKEAASFLADHSVHPLIKAAVAQAWVLVTRPFPEGNERLARLVSTVILTRAGYAFFGEVSLSSLIARNGYPYYNAVANILREENGGDLTYFVEYYLLLLAQAVEERRRRKKEAEAESRKAESELARTALSAPEHTQAHTPGLPGEDGPPWPPGPGGKTDQAYSGTYMEGTGGTETFTAPVGTPDTEPSRGDAVAESLAAEGYVSFLTPGEENNPEDGGIRWSGEWKVRAELVDMLQRQGGVIKPEFTRALIKCLDMQMYVFTSKDITGLMGNDDVKLNKLTHEMREKGLLETIGRSNNYGVYSFTAGAGLSDSDYTAGMIEALNSLADDSPSPKDRRIGGAIRSCLAQGIITIREYEAAGEEGRWAEDMKLAEQMGFVRRITDDRCLIMSDARPCFDRLDSGQKKRAKLMYDSFGDGTFSLEMVVATLDYSSSTASAYLHQFTLLRILDCRKEDVNLYQFLVNPREHPEVFEDVA